MVGLAGSLEEADVPSLAALGPDLLGFRGALCAGRSRTSPLDPGAVARIRALLERAHRDASAAVTPPPLADGHARALRRATAS